MFVQSEKFIERHQGRLDDISVYGQESNQTTYRLCRMNLAIRGIDGSNIRWNTEGSFLNNAHKDLKADYIIANPPFNVSDWSGDLLRDDPRWQFGTPPVGNANFAWVQHFLYHLNPNAGQAGFVLSNGSLSSNSGGEGQIRQNLVENDLVECIVMLPKALFFNTGIPACLWFLRRGKKKRHGEVLFIDASELGYMINRKNRVLADEDVMKVADTYHNWLESKDKYEDVKGFCKSATLEDIQKHKFVLTPGRYVGIPDEEDDGIPFQEKVDTLTTQLREQMKEAQELDQEIKTQLAKIGIEL
nr:N-6 DNA methylase [Marinilabilia salmonicolor]